MPKKCSCKAAKDLWQRGSLKLPQRNAIDVSLPGSGGGVELCFCFSFTLHVERLLSSCTQGTSIFDESYESVSGFAIQGSCFVRGCHVFSQLQHLFKSLVAFNGFQEK